MSTATERLLGAAALAALLWGAPVAAQPARGAGPAAGTATRAVAHYLDLERGLADAVAAGDEAAVMQRLAGDFESRPAGTLDPVEAGPWMRNEFARRTPARVRDLAVREAGTATIVSFVRDLGGHRLEANTLWTSGRSTATDCWPASPPRYPAGPRRDRAGASKAAGEPARRDSAPAAAHSSGAAV